MVFYQMLTGTRPFEGDTIPGVLYSVVTSSPPPLHKLRPDLPAGLTALVDVTLEKKKEDRCPSVNRLLADLSRALKQRWTEVLMAELGGADPEASGQGPAGGEAGAGRADTLLASPGEEDGGSAQEDTMMSDLPELTSSDRGAMLLVEAVHEEMPLDAEVYLDEELVGRTPTKLQGLAPGRHSLRVVCEGFRPVNRSVMLENGMREQIRVTLFTA